MSLFWAWEVYETDDVLGQETDNVLDKRSRSAVCRLNDDILLHGCPDTKCTRQSGESGLEIAGAGDIRYVDALFIGVTGQRCIPQMSWSECW